MHRLLSTPNFETQDVPFHCINTSLIVCPVSSSLVLPCLVVGRCSFYSSMAPTLPSISPTRLRSYIFRLPLFTRLILLAIIVFWVLELQSKWNVVKWGGLIPSEVGLQTSKLRSWFPTCCASVRPGFLLELQRREKAAGCAVLIVIVIVHRINTYPLIHIGFFHAFFNVLALTPLLERFEAEHGTLLTGSFFMGRTSCFRLSFQTGYEKQRERQGNSFAD